jgi:DNA repair photolyase
MNNATGNMYKFIDKTWNPIKGKCFHDCSYCYMKKFSNWLPTLRLKDDEIRENLCSGLFIFVGSNIDIFAEDIPSDWIIKVLDHGNQYNNKYLFQSKNPARIINFLDHPVFKKSVICTTIESNRNYPEVMHEAPAIEERVKAMEAISNLGFKTYVTMEPLMAFDLDQTVELIKRCKPEQVNIGRNTYEKVSIPEPTANEAKALANRLETFTKVDRKENAWAWFNK